MRINKILLIFITGILINLATPINAEQSEKPAIPDNAKEIVDFIGSNQGGIQQVKKVETEFFNIEIDSKGGVIRSFRHKDDENKLKNNVDIVTLDPFGFSVYLGHELVTLFQSSQFVITQKDDKNNYIVKATLPVSAKTKDGVLYPVNIVKTYKFNKKTHYWDYSWEIENKSRIKLYIPEMYFIALDDIGPYPKHITSSSTKSFKSFYYIDGSYKSMPIEAHVSTEADSGGFFSNLFSFGKKKQIDDKETFSGKIEYFGMGSRFMIMAIQPITPVSAITVVINSHKKNEIHAHMGQLTMEAGQSGKYDFIVYTGPKVKKFFNNSPEQLFQNERLKLVHKELYKAFDFGITAPIRDFLVMILKMLYKIIPNYGVAIILLVIGIKAVFFPLNQAQAKSMKKMQELQPKIKEINEKYKKNPQEKQRKTMELYKKEKANPVGGCLPMLIQIPIIISLISAFTDSYELWGSPFISGWINDLSEPDTVYVFSHSIPLIGGFNLNLLPIIMIVSQFLQTQFTMVTVDKNQKRMMQIVPVVMVVMFWDFPSGVVLYWILFNLLSVLQQLYTNKLTSKNTV
ncbi:MAG: YidC/Oxa1 family insertase periplasmic-domain containing protein [Spirochaetia bacterium]|nr:YidC/Oxa1 family insertase periplasmic-domain containing protein [Spirochaetia bacterium]